MALTPLPPSPVRERGRGSGLVEETASIENGVSLNRYVGALLAQGDAVARVERRLAEMDDRIATLAHVGASIRDDATARRPAALTAVGGESATS